MFLRLKERFVGFIIAFLSSSVIFAGYSIEPSASGIGTHRQMGLPPCGWMASSGMPCPSCGMTTAVSYSVRGKIVSAFVTQPAGAFFGLGVGIFGIFGIWMLITGSSFVRLHSLFYTSNIVWWTIALLVVSWIYKIFSVKGFI